MSNNAPQASPTIQELLDEIFKEQWPEIEEVNGFSNTKRQILTLFSCIITEAQPGKYIIQPETDKEARVYEGAYNAGITDFERNLRAAIAKGK